MVTPDSTPAPSSPQPPQGGIPRYSSPRDPSADHEQVEDLLAQGAEERIAVRSRGVRGRLIVLCEAW